MGLRPARCAFVLLAIVAFAPAVPAEEASKSGIEEIVVTARKRDELLVDTPVSVTALTANDLRDSGVARLNDIEDLVPNLQFSVGRENQEGYIRLRGVGTASGEIVFDPGVAVYVDGVYLPRMIGQLVDVIDVGQVEVLRGPQGTLFGKNSVGGAININTIKPHEDTEGQLLVSPGNFDTVRTRAMLNVPLIEERLLSRFAFATNTSQGFARNELLDLNVSDQASMTFLGSLRWLASDDITVDLSGTWGRDHSHGRGGQCRTINDNGLGITTVPGFREACDTSSEFRFDGNVPSLSDSTSWGSWGTVSWDALQGPIDLTVKSITSWREQKPRHRSESDLTEFAILSLDFSGSEQNPGWSQRQISQELQTNLSTWEDRLSLVSGLFGFWERGRAPTTVRALTDVLNVETQSITRVSNWSWAAYAHAVLDPVEWLSLTAGVRYTQDKKGATFSLVDRGVVGPPGDPATGSEVFDAVTPTASIGLKPTDSMLDALRLDHGLLYFTYSQGFRGGGFNSLINVQGIQGTDLPGFKPETLDNFEVGLKTLAFDNRVGVNLSAFYGEYDDIQVFSTRAIGDLDDPTTIMLQTLTQNAAAATVEGIEAEFLLNPTDELRLSGTVGLLNTKYDDFGKRCDPGMPDGIVNCAISDVVIGTPEDQFIDRSGQGFNLTPDLTTNFAISYEIAITDAPRDFLVGHVTPRLDWSYQSQMHVLGPEADDGIQNGFNLLHARISYDLWDDTAQIALWGKNLTDERYFDRAESFPILGFMARYFQTPRTFGGEVSYRF
jgi:iron complex outermembrane receptor protein